MSATTGLLSVEEFLNLPDPKEGHLELHHGEVVKMPPPKKRHVEIQDRLQTLLKRQFGARYRVHMEMPFRPVPDHEVWVADVGCVSSERYDRTGDDDYLMGAPELVVEVLSPGNTVAEINDKMLTSMANGCVSFWVVDPARQLVSVTEGAVTRHYAAPTASISCSLFEGQAALAEIFG